MLTLSRLIPLFPRVLRAPRSPPAPFLWIRTLSSLPVGVQIPQKDFTPSYDPSATEAGWTDWWNSCQFYSSSSASSSSSSSSQPRNTVLLPPPNVTGQLHLGHALTVAVEDSLVRFWRMRDGPGSTSFIPGTDHAGIGTQAVVERYLWVKENKTRHDLGREEFVKRVMEWSDLHQFKILGQLRRLGASLDWSKLYFTMDHSRSRDVTSAFIRLFNDDLIYRDTRFVNWSCHLKTAISDLEVEVEEVKGPTWLERPGGSAGKGKVLVGVLHQFAYPLAEGTTEGTTANQPKEVVVSTTRLETMLGDAAVAVHPNDERYKFLHGRFVIHPISGRKIPIVTDATLVDPTFGTGVVKVTPAHDRADYECALRHGLPVVNLLNNDGTLNEAAGEEFRGRDRFEVREDIIKRLEALGLYRGQQDHAMNISICSRSKDILEPLMRPQWFVRSKDLASRAAEDVRSGKLKIVPSVYEQDWLGWLDQPQDWCISRQLWWGHQIPAYHLEATSSDGRSLECWVVGTDEKEAREKAKEVLRSKWKLDPEVSPFKLTRDPDVLDTWFSSALLPLSTADNQEKELLKVMETGGDILFFWVARMVMLCSYLSPTKSLPFNTVMLHGIIRDAQGRKMSKSLGNVVDPLHVIEGATRQEMEQEVLTRGLSPAEQSRSLENIKQLFAGGISACGSDALRLALLSYSPQSRFINLDMKRIYSARLFCNKIWNASKFVLLQLPPGSAVQYPSPSPSILTEVPRGTLASFINPWIMSRLATTVRDVNAALETLDLKTATQLTSDFFLKDFCDTFIEFSKPVLYQSLTPQEATVTREILSSCLDASLRLFHPYMPFITEELWQHLRRDASFTFGAQEDPISISISRFPQPNDYQPWLNQTIEEEMGTLLGIIHASRSLRESLELPSGTRLPFSIVASDEKHRDAINRHAGSLEYFIQGESVQVLSEDPGDSKKTAAVIVNEKVKVLLPLSGLVDVKEHLNKIDLKTKKVNLSLEKMIQRMEGKGYAAKAPTDVRERDATVVRELNLQLEELKKNRDLFSSLGAE